MKPALIRETVDLTAYPDLVMVLLGFRANRPRALRALWGLGKGFRAIRRSPPDGLLGEEGCLFGWNHIGFRQYWRDFASLERFTRSAPHAGWWHDFLKDSQGAGFWHEAYCAKGGIEAVYVGMPGRLGLASFAPIRSPTGPLMSSRGRLREDVVSRSQALQ